MNLQAAFVVASHEVRRVRPSWQGAVAALVVASILAMIGPAALQAGVAPDRDLYPFDGEGILTEAAEADHRFIRHNGALGSNQEPLLHDSLGGGDTTGRNQRQAERTGAGQPETDAGVQTVRPREAHLAVAISFNGGVLYDDNPRGSAAASAYKGAVDVWNERQLRAERDPVAAFPVRIDVGLVQRNLLASTGNDRLAPTGGGDESLSGLVEPEDIRRNLRPGEIEPPFPIRSLLLTFAFVIPMNFVAQMVAGTLHADRVRHRGMPLLSAPVPHGAILVGRVLPYAGASLLVWMVAAIVVRTDGWGAAAAFLIVAFLLSIGALIGLVARSEREVTFLLTAATTTFSTFLFLPAVFVALPPIALLSPVSVVAAGIRGESISAAGLVYSMVPLAAMTITAAVLAAALYREETLFAPRNLWAKASEALERILSKTWRIPVAAALVVPWAFTLELFVVAMVVPLGIRAAIPLAIIAAPTVEESLKAWIGIRGRRASGASALLTGVLVGGGFFLAEKLAFVLVLLNFEAIPSGAEALGTFGFGTLGLALGPLVVHIVTATIGSTGALGGRAGRRMWWLLAVFVHMAYNAWALGRAV